MLGLLRDLCDFIFPPNDNVVVLRSVEIKNFKKNYNYQKLESGFIALSNYQRPLVKAAITANKFHQSAKAAKLLATLLEIYLEKETNCSDVWLVPIPLSTEREKERGYNQVRNITKHIKLPYCQTKNILQRVKNTTPQTNLDRTMRINNLAGAFCMASKAPIPTPATQVIVIDDVITTGATLNAAYKTLRKELPQETKIIALAIAH